MTHLHIHSRASILKGRFRSSQVSRVRMAVRHRQNGIAELRVTEEAQWNKTITDAARERRVCKTIVEKARAVIEEQVTNTAALPKALRWKIQQLSRGYGETDFGRKLSSSLT